MQLIRPTEVTGKILSLIEDAKKELIIVSPYNKFANWDKLKRYLKEATDRKIRITYYAREGEDNSCLNLLKIKPILIKMLHAKLYMNESYAILSSMNLVEASDKKSLDFAMMTTTPEQYQDVLKYFNDYIKPKAPLNIVDKSNIVNEPKKVELPCAEFFNSNPAYENKKLDLFVEYHKNTSFIKEFGNKLGGKKFGNWLYFNSDGLLEKVEEHFGSIQKEQLNYNGKVSRYYIMFTIANVAGGLFNCSIKEFYFKSYLKDFIRENPDKFFEHLKSIFELKYIDFNSKYVEELVNGIHESMVKKAGIFS